jgi:hypothetical protein
MHTDIRISSGIRTHDPNVRAGEDSSCLITRGNCDRQYSNNMIINCIIGRDNKQNIYDMEYT